MSGSGPRYYYTVGTPTPRPGRLSTSRIEVQHIAIAYVVLTFDLLLILSGSTLLAGGSAFAFNFNLPTVLLAAVAALTGFLAHELAHKIAAQRRHSWAEFRMFPSGLLLSVFTAVMGFLFAAPGATVVGGMRDLKAWGETSLAGPLTNLAFGLAFFVGAYAEAGSGSFGIVYQALIVLAFFNAWFAPFNMIPLGRLDGRKVLSWSPSVWTLTTIAAGAMVIFAYAASVLGHPLWV